MKFSIGPELGGMGYVSFLKSNETKFYGEYSFGGTVEIRPIRLLSLNTGFTYNKILNGSKYFSTPILLGVYGERMGIFGGPVLYYDNKNGKVDFNSPKIGASIGYGTSNLGIFLYYNPNNPVFEDGINNVRFFIGLGLKINLKIGFESFNVQLIPRKK